jgi:hypothetical protein
VGWRKRAAAGLVATAAAAGLLAGCSDAKAPADDGAPTAQASQVTETAGQAETEVPSQEPTTDTAEPEAKPEPTPGWVTSPFTLEQALEAVAWVKEYGTASWDLQQQIPDAELAKVGTAPAGKVAIISYASGMCPRGANAGRQLLAGRMVDLPAAVLPVTLAEIQYVIALDYANRYGVNYTDPTGQWVNNVIVDTTVSLKDAATGEVVTEIASLQGTDPLTEPTVCDTSDVNCIPTGTICQPAPDPTEAISQAIAAIP